MSALLSHLVLLSENIHLRKHFKENEKEMIKEDDIESKKGGRKMVCGMKGAVHSNTARRRAGRRGEGRARGCALRVCTHVHSHVGCVCALTCVYSRVPCAQSHVGCVCCVCTHVPMCVFTCVPCIVTCAVSMLCVHAHVPVCVHVCCAHRHVCCVHTHTCVYSPVCCVQSCVPVCVFTCAMCIVTCAVCAACAHICGCVYIHVCAHSHVCCVCTHTCVYSPVCCVHSHVCSGHVLYLLAVFARAWRAQGYRGSGRQRGLGQSVGEGPEWGSPLKWGEGTGQRLGLAGVRRKVRSPWRLAWPGVSLEAAAGIGQGLVIKGSTWPAPSAMMPAVGGVRCLLLGFRETCGKEEDGALPSPGAGPGTWSSLVWNWGSGLQ